MISDGGLKAAGTGIDLDLRLPWYRALPLSVVTIDEVAIDGKALDLAPATFSINGKTMPLSAFATGFEDWWFTADSGILHVPDVTLPAGSRHEVEATIAVKPPYIPGLVRITKCKKQLSLQ